MKKKRNSGSSHNEKGAIMVEATISLSIFIFFMFTLLSLVQIAYTQARVSVALDSVNKRIAEYAHVYFATGLDDALPNSGGKSSDIANEVADFLKELGGSEIFQNEFIDLGDFGAMISGAGTAIEGDSLTRLIKHGVGGLLVNQMLTSSLGDDFCQRNHIVDGFHTGQVKFLENGSDIFLEVHYDIRVIQLLNLDYKFHMSSCSYTQAWSGK